MSRKQIFWVLGLCFAFRMVEERVAIIKTMIQA